MDFPVSLKYIKAMLSFVREHSQRLGFDDANISKIEMATEEALSNVIKYSGLTKDQTLSIDCITKDHAIHIIITDDGLPFNPLENMKENVIFPIPLEDRKPGGYGVFLMIQMMDEVNYQHHKQCNILTLTKYLSE